MKRVSVLLNENFPTPESCVAISSPLCELLAFRFAVSISFFVQLPSGSIRYLAKAEWHKHLSCN